MTTPLYTAKTTPGITRAELLVLLAEGSVTAMRHGNARKEHPSGLQPDGERGLTDAGVAMARHHNAYFGFARPPFTSVTSSTYPRVYTTINEATGYKYANDLIKMEELTPSDKPEDTLNKLFHELGYKALLESDGKSGYFNREDPDECAAVESFGHNALRAVINTLSEVPDDGHHLLVGSHAVAVPVFVWALCQVLGTETPGVAKLEKIALNLNIKEGQAIEIKIGKEGQVTSKLLTPPA